VLAVLSVAGGAICRIAALQFAGAEKPGLRQAVRFGLRKFTAFFCAPLTPMIIILVIGAIIILLGAWGNIPYVGELAVGLLLPLAFAVAILITIIAIGIVGGCSLMFPTIAYEDSDCFDSISRSFSYVYNKPWRMGLYVVMRRSWGDLLPVVRFFHPRPVDHPRFQPTVYQNKKLTTGPSPRSPTSVRVSAPPNWSTSIVPLCLLLPCRYWIMVSSVISFYFGKYNHLRPDAKSRDFILLRRSMLLPQEPEAPPLRQNRRSPPRRAASSGGPDKNRNVRIITDPIWWTQRASRRAQQPVLTYADDGGCLTAAEPFHIRVFCCDGR
jgi:hypothetical protein